MAAVDDEEGKRKGCGAASIILWEEEIGNGDRTRTVAEDELANSGDVHSDAAKKVVSAAESRERYIHDG